MQRKSVRDDFYEQERYANQELRRFRANYPENAALIQNYVEDACDRMDYEGSRMYDEYPDRYMLKKKLCVDFKPDKKRTARRWEWKQDLRKSVRIFQRKL